MLRFLLAFSLLNAVFGYQKCPPGTLLSAHSSRCFKFIAASVDFPTARDACIEMGGDLASIHDKTDMNMLGHNTTHLYWLGGENRNGQWSWTDGSAFNFTNWIAGGPPSSGSQCLIVDSITGLWNGMDCARKVGYVCEVLPATCPKGMLCFEDNAYRLIGSLKNWEDAEKFCVLLSGHLASIHKQEEQTIVSNLLTKNDRNRAWIGARVTSSQLTWTDGSKNDFQDWGSGYSPNVQDSCVSNFQTSGWQSTDCEKSLQSICEIPLSKA